MSALPPFAVTSVGSWPRSAALLKALPSRRQGTLTAAGFLEVARKDVRACVQAQERAGVDRVTDGEQTRDNFYSFVAERLDGVQLMTLAEMLDVVEDKAGFQSLLDTLDVPAFAISNPTCVGALALREPLAVDDLAFVRTQTSKPIKVTLPGPYLLTRAMWVPEVSRRAYDSKEALGTFMCAALAARKDPQEELEFAVSLLSRVLAAAGSTRAARNSGSAW